MLAGSHPTFVRTAAILLCSVVFQQAAAQTKQDIADADFSSELPRIQPVEPVDALKTFTVHPDFELQLVAHEPDVVDPIAACFDAYGRLYVVEMRGYSEQRDEKLARVRRLEDRDNDGIFERSMVFADGLKWPTAITPYDGGVFVAAAPHIYYLKDGLAGKANGDGADKVDGEYPVILTGLNFSNVQGLANSMRWGLDGRIHVATSSSGAELRRPHRPDEPALLLRGRDFSFDPRLVRQVLPSTAIDPRLHWDETQWKKELESRINRFQVLGLDERNAEFAASEDLKRVKRRLYVLKTRLRYSRPRKPSLRAESGGGQHGMCFDDHFRKFVCQNSDHIQFVRYEDRYAARAMSVPAPRPRRSIAVDGPQAEVFRTSKTEPWRVVRTRLRVAGLVGGPIEGGGRAAGYFTGATGTTIYRGDNWPGEYRGQAFIGDVGSNIIHRKIMTPDGLGFRANRARDGVEFIASTDSWFRPVQFLNGPDGNLYILDMYRETIEHPKSLPPAIKRHLDLTSGRDRGRIYRVVSKKTKRKGPIYPAAKTPLGLVTLLDSPNAWARETAARLLLEKQSETTIEPLRKLVRTGTPLGRMHALQSLGQVRLSLDEASLLFALSDRDAVVREQAVRLAESRLRRWTPVRDAVAALADDPSLHVRAQVAFSAHNLGDKLVPTVRKILRTDGDNDVIRFAAIASSKGHAVEVIANLSKDEAFRNSAGGVRSLAMLSDLAVADGKAKEVLDLARSVSPDDPSLAVALTTPVAKANRRQPDPAITTGLTNLAVHAMKTLANRDEPVKNRAAACKLVSFHSSESIAASSLLGIVHSSEPKSVQLAAIDSIGVLTDKTSAARLIERYQQLTPPIQQTITATLLSRVAWAEQLLSAINDRKLPRHAITTAQLNSLRNSRSDRLNQLVLKLTMETHSTPRAQVVSAWQDVLNLDGNASNGRAIFRKTCSKCHRLEGVGEQLGPGLAAIRNRGVDAVLMNILDPNREVNPQYSSYSVLTTDGRTFTGAITSETASGVTLRDGERTNITLGRDDIEEIRNTGMSLMPEGLEKDITKQQMADLLEYLMTVKH